MSTQPDRAFIGNPKHPRPPELGFRPISDADLEFLCALYAEGRQSEMAPVPWPEAAKLDFLAQQFALQHQHYLQHYPGADLLLIERCGRPIGRIYVYRSPAEIRLMDIALIAAERGQKLGTALLAELIDEADASAAKITLHVEASNPVQRLYTRLGFQLIEDRGPYQFLAREPVQQSARFVPS